MRSRITISSVAARAASAAGDLDSESDEEPGEVIESAPPLEVGEERIVNKSTGLNKKLIKKGAGWLTPQIGDEVTVHYVGMFEDGNFFDSSRERGEPFTFLLGKGVFDSAFDEGIITMTKGELALFTFPCSLVNEAFYVRWNITPGFAVKFEVELMSWLTVLDVSKDGGIVKKILINGDDVQTNDLDEVLDKINPILRMSSSKSSCTIAEWTGEHTVTLIALFYLHIATRQGRVSAWYKEIAALLNAEHNIDYSGLTIKHKWDNMKRKFQFCDRLLQTPDGQWNVARDTVEGSDDWRRSLLFLRKYRKNSPPQFREMNTIFEGCMKKDTCKYTISTDPPSNFNTQLYADILNDVESMMDLTPQRRTFRPDSVSSSRSVSKK